MMAGKRKKLARRVKKQKPLPAEVSRFEIEQVPVSLEQPLGVSSEQAIGSPLQISACSLTKLKTLTSSIHLNRELEKLCNLTVVDWPYYGKLQAAIAPLLYPKTLWRCLHDFDILHIQYDIAGYMPLFLPMMWLLSLNKRAKVVFTLHEKYDNVPLARLVILFHNLWYRQADALLVHTQEHKEFLPKCLQERTIVVPHGVIEAQGVHHSFNSNAILFAGYVNAWKGHDLAVKAMPLVLGEIPDAKLVFLPRSNDLAYEKRIKELIEDLHLTSHIEWNDKRIEEHEMFRYFDEAAISLLPYRRITMSGILSHTLSRGVPAVLSDLPAFMEVTRGKALYFRNGDPVDLAHRIIQLLKRKDLQKKMSRDFVELTREYAWSRMARLTLRVYETLMGKSH